MSQRKSFIREYLPMATNDFIYDLAKRLEEDNIEFLLITVQKGKEDHNSTALYNIQTIDGSDIIYTTFEEVYNVVGSPDTEGIYGADEEEDDDDEEN
jgi:hypothetical protein